MAALEYGWVGKILRVDLTAGKTSIVPTENYAPKYFGGRAMAAKIYWDEVPPSCGAFDPENKLIIMTGVASGNLGASSSRMCVTAKSPHPIPESYMMSVTGGHFPSQLKFAGFDGLIVEGKAKEPVYIAISDGKAEILNAERLWGMTTSQTEAEIMSYFGEKNVTITIGPAGENLVRTACIIGDRGHATGVGGFGAVMGSKNLKAVTVKGTGAVKVARPEELINVFNKYVRNGAEYGGPYCVSSMWYHICRADASKKPTSVKQWFDTGYGVPVDPVFASLYLGYDEEIQGTLKRKFLGCFACPVDCSAAFHPKDPAVGAIPPQDMSVSSVVAQQCSDVIQARVIEAARYNGRILGRPQLMHTSLCQEYGVSVNNPNFLAGAWRTDAQKAGLLTNENTGLPLDEPWSSEFISGFVRKVSYREGDLFYRIGEGEERFLDGMAKESADWKKIYDSRVGWLRYHASTGVSAGSKEPVIMLIEATTYRSRPNRPIECFSTMLTKTLAGLAPPEAIIEAQKKVREKGVKLLGLSPESFDLPGEPKNFHGKVSTVAFFEPMEIEADSVPYCSWAGHPRFHSPNTPDLVGSDGDIGAKLTSAITGINRTMVESVKSFEPVVNIERAIHVREGRRREDDWFSDAVFEANKSWTSKADFNQVLDEYYTARGWGIDNGIPTRKKLEDLGLKDVADDLDKKYSVKVPA